MAIVMNMSSYEIERDIVEAEYGKKALCSELNPALALSQQQFISTAIKQRAMPASLATVNVELFLQKM